VEQLKDLYFSHAMKFICDCCEYDYYSLKKEEEKESELLKWLDTIESKKFEQKDIELKPLNEIILNQYVLYPNEWLLNEHIDIKTQKLFEICYDIRSERIVYPIRDEIGSLIGCKGRTTNKDIEDEYKFLPLYIYPKSKICYGLHLTLPHIKQKKKIYVFEAEKSVLKMWSMSYKNSIGIGGLIPSETQMNKILKLNCDIVFAWDSALKEDDKKNINKFLEEYKILANIYVIYDKWNLTKEKDSPCDRGKEIWEELNKRRIKIS
jgi:DNA primase